MRSGSEVPLAAVEQKAHLATIHHSNILRRLLHFRWGATDDGMGDVDGMPYVLYENTTTDDRVARVPPFLQGTSSQQAKIVGLDSSCRHVKW